MHIRNTFCIIMEISPYLVRIRDHIAALNLSYRKSGDYGTRRIMSHKELTCEDGHYVTTFKFNDIPFDVITHIDAINVDDEHNQYIRLDIFLGDTLVGTCPRAIFSHEITLVKPSFQMITLKLTTTEPSHRWAIDLTGGFCNDIDAVADVKMVVTNDKDRVFHAARGL